MKSRFSPRLAFGALVVMSLAVPVGVAAADTRSETLDPTACDDGLSGDVFVRTELFFGQSQPDGRVSEREFDRFVDGAVTPRFPAGLTVLSGLGQFQLADGNIVEEKSKVLVLLHGGSADESAAIDAIRDDYIDAFDQESVLRTDTTSCVGF